MRTQDLSGMTFGRLTAVKCIGKNRNGKYVWECRCSCGKHHCVEAQKLKSGHTKSCGCYHDEASRMKENKHRKHGLVFSCDGKKTRLYRIWTGMKTRCLNPNSDHFDRYMGRGITICEEWRDNFKAFHDWAIMNGYRDDLTIDRIDPNGNYCPENCRWETAKSQTRNRGCTVSISFNGESKTLKEWSQIIGVPYTTLYARYKRGLSPEAILTSDEKGEHHADKHCECPV